MAQKRISITIPEKLLEQFKTICVIKNTTCSKVITQFIQKIVNKTSDFQKTKILITVPEELHKTFLAACNLKGVTHSHVITDFITKYVDEIYPDLKIDSFFLKDKETSQNENQ